MTSVIIKNYNPAPYALSWKSLFSEMLSYCRKVSSSPPSIHRWTNQIFLHHLMKALALGLLLLTLKKLAIFSQTFYHFLMSRASKGETQGTSKKCPFCFPLNINNHSRTFPPSPYSTFSPWLSKFIKRRKILNVCK